MGLSFFAVLKTAFATLFVCLLGAFAEQFSGLGPGILFTLIICLFVVVAAYNSATAWKQFEPMQRLVSGLPRPVVEGLMKIESPAQFIDFLDNALVQAHEKALKYEELAKGNLAWGQALDKELGESKNQIAEGKKQLEETTKNYYAKLEQLSNLAKGQISDIAKEKTALKGQLDELKSELARLQEKYAAFENDDMEGMRSFYQSQVGRLNRSGKTGAKRQAELSQED